MRWLLVNLPFIVYRAVFSPILHFLGGPGLGCRFEPTCSHYAQLSLQRHGFFRGCLLTIHRIGRCHPFTTGGFDPVPPCDRGSEYGT